MREFNRGRELFLNFFLEVARIIRNPVMRELIETICANYLKLRAPIIVKFVLGCCANYSKPGDARIN